MSGPIVPSAGVARWYPVGDAAITGGLWFDLQALNRSVTIREAFRELERAGNLHNFRVAAGDESGEYRGKLYLDSDVYKVLEAVAWEQGRSPADDLAAWQDGVTDLVARAQRRDGYLNTFVQLTRNDQDRYADLTTGHELFCGGHLIQAGVAQARATGSSRLLEVARRYADHLVDTFGPGRLESTDGHPEIEMALVELYRETATEAYLELARFLVDVRGHGVLGGAHFGSAYFQDEQPVRSSRRVRGHAVRQVFLDAGVTDLHLETGEDDLLQSSVARWEDMVAGKTYLTGGIGARWEGEAFGDAFELPPDSAYAETCAAHGSILWSWRLLLTTGDARYAELIERTLYNGFAAGLSLDGTRFYYVNPLQNRPDAAAESNRSAHHGRQSWYGTACCPPNVMRTLASLQHYVATHDADGVQLHQHVTGTLSVPRPTGQIVLQTVSGLPWDGAVRVQVQQTPDERWALSLRIPSWAGGATAELNGQPIDSDVPVGDYLTIDRTWAAGDVLTLHLPCVPRWTAPDHRIDAVRGTLAVERGPLVYAFEQIDQSPGVDLDLVELVPELPLQESWEPGLLGGVVTVTARGREVRPTASDGSLPYGPWPGQQDPDRRLRPDVSLVAVPYLRWANREVDTMRVFLATASTADDVARQVATRPITNAEENR